MASLCGYSKAAPYSDYRLPIFGDACASVRVVEAHRTAIHRVKRDGRIQVIAENQKISKRPLDVTWLTGASETYHISSDINDFVIVAIPIVTADIPNRNADCFPLHELAYFNPILGTYTYRTFVGKPTHKDHVNQDPTKAKGAHFDVRLARWKHNSRFWKTTVLAGFDRSKDGELVGDILSGRRRGYSMGALVDHTRCSICGEVSSDRVKCAHMERVGKSGIFMGQLVYDCCHGVNFIETSSVADPADIFANSDAVYAG
jgi:hypothetical protein